MTWLDATVLNFALTLEHLENAFYQGALAKFDQKAFTAAGLPTYARGRFAQVAEHEKTHVKFLSDALGDKATQPCTYNL
jgi:rubrerythrin